VSTSITLTTVSPDDTREAAAAIASVLGAGDVVALSGDLGAGKTCFVQGAAAGLGVALPVTSPTFVLVKLLPAPVPVVHVDVYRLEGLRHLDEVGEDVFAPDVITLVEWADTIRGLLPDDRLEVELHHQDGDAGADTRRLTLQALGPGWARRHLELERVCAPWRREGDGGERAVGGG
jgi:tRNA threonylcarbamoyladenosine biosynthesis protein TsaE